MVINAKTQTIRAVRAAVERGATEEELVEIAEAVWKQNRRAYANIVMAAGKSLNISILATIFSHSWRDLGDSVPQCVVDALRTKARIVLMVNSKQGKKELQKEGLHEVLGLDDWRYAKDAGVPKAEDTSLSTRALFKREWIVEQAEHIYLLDGGDAFDRTRWTNSWLVITTQPKFWQLARDFDENGEACNCEIGDDEVRCRRASSHLLPLTSSPLTSHLSPLASHLLTSSPLTSRLHASSPPAAGRLVHHRRGAFRRPARPGDDPPADR